MSIQKKSLISTLKTTKKANAASSEPAAVTGKSAISTKHMNTKQISTRRAGVSAKQISSKQISTKQISTRRAGVSAKAVLS